MYRNIIMPPPTTAEELVKSSPFNYVSPATRELNEKNRLEALQAISGIDLGKRSSVNIHANFAIQDPTFLMPHQESAVNRPERNSVSKAPSEESREVTKVDPAPATKQCLIKKKNEGKNETLPERHQIVDGLCVIASGIACVAVAYYSRSLTMTAAVAGFTASMAYKYYKRYISDEPDPDDHERGNYLFADSGALVDSAMDGACCALTTVNPLIGIGSLGVKYYLCDDKFQHAVNSATTSGLVSGGNAVMRYLMKNPSWLLTLIAAFVTKRILSDGSSKKDVQNEMETPRNGISRRVRWFKRAR